MRAVTLFAGLHNTICFVSWKTAVRIKSLSWNVDVFDSNLMNNARDQKLFYWILRFCLSNCIKVKSKI